MLGKRKNTFGVTFFNGDDLQVLILQAEKGRVQLVAGEKLTFPSNYEKAGDSTGPIEDFKNKMSMYQKSHSPYWIHLVLRYASFVKSFSVPDVPPEQLEETVSKRIQSEIPYLAEEVILHQVLQEGVNGRESLVLLFGVSKSVLSDQSEKLQSIGIMPDRVSLSTEVLAWYYRTHLIPQESPDHLTLFVHLFSNQVEMLFFDEHMLLQSRWISQEQQPSVSLQETIRASVAGFQREWHRKPEFLLIVGNPAGTGAFVVDPSFTVRQIDDGQQGGDAVPPLIQAVIASYQVDEIFDYTLPTERETRDKTHRVRGLRRVAQSFAAFSFVLCLLAFIQSGLVLAQIGWYQIKMASFSDSVKDIKKMRKEAIAIKDFYQKKAMPVLLLSALRSAVPNEILFREVEYDASRSELSIRGISMEQSVIDGFVSRLEADAAFDHVQLDRVQSERNETGKALYHFVIKTIVSQE